MIALTKVLGQMVFYEQSSDNCIDHMSEGNAKETGEQTGRQPRELDTPGTIHQKKHTSNLASNQQLEGQVEHAHKEGHDFQVQITRFGIDGIATC